MIRPLAERHLAAFAGRGHAELMSEYCEPVSVLALGEVLGLGELEADTLRRWFADLAAGGSNFENDPEKQRLGDAASADVDRVAGPILDRLAAEPTTACWRTCCTPRRPAAGSPGPRCWRT